MATPGRLIDMRHDSVSFTGLESDKADRMLDMGFSPDTARPCRPLPSLRQTLLFSATMPADAEADEGPLHECEGTCRVGAPREPAQAYARGQDRSRGREGAMAHARWLHHIICNEVRADRSRLIGMESAPSRCMESHAAAADGCREHTVLVTTRRRGTQPRHR